MAPSGLFGAAPNRPSWASMIERQIDSPIPMPPDLVVNSGLNICSSSCEPIPVPVSATDTIPSYLWQLGIRLGLDQYTVPLQVAPRQGEGFRDKFVDVERRSVPGVLLEDRPNASDHCSRTMAVGHDLPECRLGLIEIGDRAIKPVQARIGIRYHPGQGL